MDQKPVTRLPVLILAAGQSRRMRGRDKLLEQVEGQPLILRQATQARAATLGPVLVALPQSPHPRHAALTGLDVTRLEVPDAAEGLSASLRRGLQALPDDAPATMLLLGDLPELTTDDLRQVFQAVDLGSKTTVWRATTEDGSPGHPIVVSSDLFDQLMSLQGDSGGAEILKSQVNATTFIPLQGQRARCDLDTPEDWAAWRVANGKNGEP
ncbi:MAG: nucleotidyltransferase family protein [Pseudomonadota bacterium]